MKLVYLFTKLNERKNIEEFIYEIKYVREKKGEQINPIINPIGSTCLVVIFTINGQSREAAHDLSDLHTEFSDRFKCQCIENGTGAYFNKILFPKMNDFERMLRQYIYIKQQIAIASLDNQISTETDEELKKELNLKRKAIVELFRKKALEEMDFTEIYTKLFVDSRFCDAIKSRFFPENAGKNATAYKVSKEEYLDFIFNQDEHIIWSDLTDGKLDIIKENYREIKNIRNGIMHAHNGDFASFEQSERMINNVLKELETEINNAITSYRPLQNKEKLVMALKQLADSYEAIRSVLDLTGEDFLLFQSEDDDIKTDEASEESGEEK